MDRLVEVMLVMLDDEDCRLLEGEVAQIIFGVDLSPEFSIKLAPLSSA